MSRGTSGFQVQKLTGTSTSGGSNALAIAVTLLVALAPLPFGGNRPFLWPTWAFAVAITVIVFTYSLLIRGRTLALPATAFGMPGLAFTAICTYLLIQCLPIASWFGLSEIGAPAGIIRTSNISLAPGETLLMLLRWLGFGLLFFLAAQFGVSRGRAIAVLQALYLVLVAYALLGIILLALFGDTLLGIDKWAYRGFATATFVNRNSYATFLAFGLAIGSALLASGLASDSNAAAWRTQRGTIGLHLASLGTILIALAATGSRMGLFAGLLGSAVVFLVALTHRPPNRTTALLIPLIMVGGGTLLLLVFGGSLLDRVSGIENDANRGSSSIVRSGRWSPSAH